MNEMDKIIRENLKHKQARLNQFKDMETKSPEELLLMIFPMLPDFNKKEEMMNGLKFQPAISKYRRYQLNKEGKVMHENKLFIIYRFKKHDWIVAKEQIDQSIFEGGKDEK